MQHPGSNADIHHAQGEGDKINEVQDSLPNFCRGMSKTRCDEVIPSQAFQKCSTNWLFPSRRLKVYRPSMQVKTEFFVLDGCAPTKEIGKSINKTKEHRCFKSRHGGCWVCCWWQVASLPESLCFFAQGNALLGHKPSQVIKPKNLLMLSSV